MTFFVCMSSNLGLCKVTRRIAFSAVFFGIWERTGWWGGCCITTTERGSKLYNTFEKSVFFLSTPRLESVGGR